jgi:hypothetical protein
MDEQGRALDADAGQANEVPDDLLRLPRSFGLEHRVALALDLGPGLSDDDWPANMPYRSITYRRRFAQQLGDEIDKPPRGRYRRLGPLQRHNRARPGFIVGYGLQVVSMRQRAAQFGINARIAACQELNWLLTPPCELASWPVRSNIRACAACSAAR